jgi:adenine specific DNA methylase Mod
MQYEKHDADYIKATYRYHDDQGVYATFPLLNPNDNRPNLTYEFLGMTRVWRWEKERMQKAFDDGIIVQAHDGAVPRYKKYLSDSKGKTITNVWTDIEQASTRESLGYPTQKPVALLERIIKSSSNEGDLVLDPFCGCGTTIHAAQKLNRGWIGIDITHLAISLIEKRMKDAFPGIIIEIHGTPKDIESARDLAKRDKYQFQWWACSLVNAQPFAGKKKGADTGIDGIIYFQEELKDVKKILVSVKGGEHVGVAMIRDFIHVVDREEAAIGLFVTLEEPTGPMSVEATSAGYYKSSLGTSFPKIQILTIDNLLNCSQRPLYPDITSGGLTFKKAKQEDEDNTIQEELF